MKNLIQTEYPGYYRDRSGAIVHRNDTAHEMFLSQRRQARENRELSETVTHLSDELKEIKSILSTLINNQNR